MSTGKDSVEGNILDSRQKTRRLDIGDTLFQLSLGSHYLVFRGIYKTEHSGTDGVYL